MSDELAELRAELAALKQQVASTQASGVNEHLNRQAADARREAGNELALRANKDTTVVGVSDIAKEAAKVLMDHDPLFWRMAQQAKENG